MCNIDTAIATLRDAEARLAKATQTRTTAEARLAKAKAEAEVAKKTAEVAKKRAETLKQPKAKTAAEATAAAEAEVAKKTAKRVTTAEARLAKATAEAETAKSDVTATERETREARLTAVADCATLATTDAQTATKIVRALMALNSLTRDEQDQLVNIAVTMLQRRVVLRAKCKMSYYAKGAGWSTDTVCCEAITTSPRKVVVTRIMPDYYSNKTASNRMRNIGLEIATSNNRNKVMLLSSMRDICDMRLV